MAGKKLKLNILLASSTLLEVIIAMVLILTVFGIAMMIYANIVASSPTLRKILAQTLLKDELHKNEETFNYTDQTVFIAEIRIDQKILPFKNNTGLSEIHLTAYDADQHLLAELVKIVDITDVNE